MFIKCSHELLLLKIMSPSQVNSSKELNVESNVPPKRKMRAKDTHHVWTDDKVQLLLEITFESKESVCEGRVRKHIGQI